MNNRGGIMVELLFFGALGLLILAVFIWTQTESTDYKKAQVVLTSLQGELNSLKVSLDKFEGTCRNFSTKLDAMRVELDEAKAKLALVDEKKIPSKIDHGISFEKPVFIKPIQVELITREPLLQRAGIAAAPVKPATPTTIKARKQKELSKKGAKSERPRH